jgi:hypothetical protein
VTLAGDGSDKPALSTVAIALRHALGRNAALGPGLSALLAQLLSEEDLAVREETLRLVVATLHHSRADAFGSLLVSDICPRVLAALSFKQVVEIDLGPFKQKNDLALTLRRLALDCVDALLALVPDVCAGLLEALPVLLKDDEGIKLHSHKLICRLSQIQPIQLVDRLDSLIEPLQKTIFAKIADTKKGPELERNMEVIKSGVRVVAAINCLSDAAASQRWLDLVDGVKKLKLTNDFLEAILAEKDA